MPDTTALKSTDASATAVDAPPATDTGPAPGKPRSLWSDAWHDLRRNPLFIVSMVLILLLAVMSIFPGLFTSASPRKPTWPSTTSSTRTGATSSPPTGSATTVRDARSTRVSCTAPAPRSPSASW